MGDLELGGKSGSESGVCGRGGLGGFAPEGERLGVVVLLGVTLEGA